MPDPSRDSHIRVIDRLLDLVLLLHPRERRSIEMTLRGLEQAVRWKMFTRSHKQELDRLEKHITRESGAYTWRD